MEELFHTAVKMEPRTKTVAWTVAREHIAVQTVPTIQIANFQLCPQPHELQRLESPSQRQSSEDQATFQSLESQQNVQLTPLELIHMANDRLTLIDSASRTELGHIFQDRPCTRRERRQRQQNMLTINLLMASTIMAMTTRCEKLYRAIRFFWILFVALRFPYPNSIEIWLQY